MNKLEYINDWTTSMHWNPYIGLYVIKRENLSTMDEISCEYIEDLQEALNKFKEYEEPRI